VSLHRMLNFECNLDNVQPCHVQAILATLAKAVETAKKADKKPTKTKK
jgi:hypothetical protein